MRTNTPDLARQIDALTVASEYIMCAIRALAMGETMNESGVKQPLEWSLSKIKEAQRGSWQLAD